MHISRILREQIIEKLKKTDKAVIIYGARQLGKTTLAKKIIKELRKKTLSINADQLKYIDVLSSRDLDKIKALVYGYEMLFIDEAQRIPDIGINLKIILDELPGIKILATGSSSFQLANKVNEPLTGRKWSYSLFPVSLQELSAIYNPFELKEKTNELLRFGSYPEVLTTINAKDKTDLINEIGNSYLYKDVLELSTIRYPNKFRDLLKLLSFQTGSEVSILELSQNLSINRETVENYLSLLEQSFIVFRLSGYSKNLRKEVAKRDKFYFYDLGIRNLVINNFKPLEDRDDVGALWENFIIAERKKYLAYNGINASTCFWRTYTGAEIDYIEEIENILHGFEIKYKKSESKPPATWIETYKNSSFQTINKENYLEFLV